MLKRTKKSIIIPASLFIIIIFLLNVCYTINEGERGVLLRYGKIVRVAEPGLGFKIPWVEAVQKIPLQKNSMLFKDIQAYSQDQQPATMSVSVNFHVPISAVKNLYISYLTLDNLKNRLIARKVPAQVEIIFGQYNAINAIQNRERLIQDVLNALRTSIIGPVMIDSVQIEGINFSADYESSIEERMKAEVAIATNRQNLETTKIEAQIVITQAQAKAESLLVSAKADAESIRLKGAAEADVIRLRGAALQKYPELIRLTTAEQWNGKLPETMIPGGSVPFISTR